MLFPCGDLTYSIPDVPWNKPCGTRCLWDNGSWAVREFGLEPLYSKDGDRYEAYVISAAHLLDMRSFAPVYFWPTDVATQARLDLDAFEDAFKKALEIHCRKYRLVVNDDILARSFRRARGLRRRLSPKAA
jgi:hypothetical protein